MRERQGGNGWISLSYSFPKHGIIQEDSILKYCLTEITFCSIVRYSPCIQLTLSLQLQNIFVWVNFVI